MKLIKLNIKTKSYKYPIIIGSNLISNISKIISGNLIKFNKCLLVVDKNISKKIILKVKKSLKQKKTYIYFFNASEINKNQNNVNKILDILLNKNFSREDCLISIGGGITGDISGFAASLFKRGLKFINIPTTLLSQVDSSIGGKTGVNTKYGKNLIGSFYQPNLVISDIQFLKTLPKREIVCGYGEILKHSLIANKFFYNFLNKNNNKIFNLTSPFIERAIYESCKIKKYVVQKDEKEKGLRKILNFGHTFAHAYEATLGYSKKLNHGEAVILGIISALNFSLKNNLIKKSEHSSIINHISNSNLPSKISKFFKLKDLNKILSFMLKDKKNTSDKISLVLLKKIGSPLINKEYNKKSLSLFLKDELSNQNLD
jgi:3-dehydroquinate synthase/shikimate kinase/3-dehydroquinate synthase